MSARFEALPRRDDRAKWLVLLPRVFVPVYLRAARCCMRTHACVCMCVWLCVSRFHLYSGGRTLADCGSVHACVKQIQNLVKKY